MKNIMYYTLLSGWLVFLAGCQNALEEEVFSELGPSNFYQTRADAEALLNAVYAEEQMHGDASAYYLLMNELSTDIMIDRGGGLENLLKPLEDFTWDGTHPYIENIWDINYRIINRANLVIDKAPGIPIDEEVKSRLIAEARFLRAQAYYYLNDLYGPVPIIETSEVSLTERPSRPDQQTMNNFIETEYRAVAEVLPLEASEYGRATKGAALAMLAKFYLNNKDWPKTVETTGEVMQLGVYSLFEGANRTDLYSLSNEQNSEYIWVRTYEPVAGRGLVFLPRAAPPGYQFKFPPKPNFATNYKIYSSFYDTFDPADERRMSMITEYVNMDGDTVQLGTDDIRSFKYPEDPNAIDRWSGNDVPVVRYADILLSRAEALNEINGPTQEAVDLINQVREKADLAPLNLSDFASTEVLRDHILDERGWEFFNEEIRRQDLIRHGKYITLAQQRGKAAMDYHVKFPLPQDELDKNENLKQNEGYLQSAE